MGYPDGPNRLRIVMVPRVLKQKLEPGAWYLDILSTNCFQNTQSLASKTEEINVQY